MTGTEGAAPWSEKQPQVTFPSAEGGACPVALCQRCCWGVSVPSAGRPLPAARVATEWWQEEPRAGRIFQILVLCAEAW